MSTHDTRTSSEHTGQGPLLVPTAFVGIEDLVAGLEGRFGERTVILYGAASRQEGEEIEFSLLLEDGRVALAGVGVVSAVADGGEERHPDARFDVVIVDIRLFEGSDPDLAAYIGAALPAEAATMQSDGSFSVHPSSVHPSSVPESRASWTTEGYDAEAQDADAYGDGGDDTTAEGAFAQEEPEHTQEALEAMLEASRQADEYNEHNMHGMAAEVGLSAEELSRGSSGSDEFAGAEGEPRRSSALRESGGWASEESLAADEAYEGGSAGFSVPPHGSMSVQDAGSGHATGAPTGSLIPRDSSMWNRLSSMYPSDMPRSASGDPLRPYQAPALPTPEWLLTVPNRPVAGALQRGARGIEFWSAANVPAQPRPSSGLFAYARGGLPMVESAPRPDGVFDAPRRSLGMSASATGGGLAMTGDAAGQAIDQAAWAGDELDVSMAETESVPPDGWDAEVRDSELPGQGQGHGTLALD